MASTSSASSHAVDSADWVLPEVTKDAIVNLAVLMEKKRALTARSSALKVCHTNTQAHKHSDTHTQTHTHMHAHTHTYDHA